MPAIYNAYRGCHTPATHRAIVAKPVVEFKPRSHRGRQWSSTEDAMLLKLKAEQLQWTVIGQRIGRAPNSCLMRHRKLCGEA